MEFRRETAIAWATDYLTHSAPSGGQVALGALSTLVSIDTRPSCILPINAFLALSPMLRCHWRHRLNGFFFLDKCGKERAWDY